MNSLFVRKGDNVLLIAGKNKGRTGKVLAVNPDTNRVVVEGWNVIIKHVKAKSAQATGGIQKMPGSIDASNVQVVCPACDKATRIAAGTDAEGKKIRVCKHCGASLDVKQKAEKKTKKKKDEAAAETKAAKKPVKTAKKAEKPAEEAKADAEVKAEAVAEKPEAEKKPVKKAVKKAEKPADAE